MDLLPKDQFGKIWSTTTSKQGTPLGINFQINNLSNSGSMTKTNPIGTHWPTSSSWVTTTQQNAQNWYPNQFGPRVKNVPEKIVTGADFINIESQIKQEINEVKWNIATIISEPEVVISSSEYLENSIRQFEIKFNFQSGYDNEKMIEAMNNLFQDLFEGHIVQLKDYL